MRWTHLRKSTEQEKSMKGAVTQTERKETRSTKKNKIPNLSKSFLIREVPVLHETSTHRAMADEHMVLLVGEERQRK